MDAQRQAGGVSAIPLGRMPPRKQAFMEDVTLVLDDFDVIEEESVVSTKWKFKCVLGLPWRPSLAASGGTKHVFDKETNRMVQHIESWNIDPVVALRQLIKPGKKQQR